jgi:hypothetical protein
MNCFVLWRGTSGGDGHNEQFNFGARQLCCRTTVVAGVRGKASLLPTLHTHRRPTAVARYA